MQNRPSCKQTKWFVDIKNRIVNFFFFKPVYRVPYQTNGGGGRLLGGGGVRLLGIIQYVSVRNWPKPGKLVAFCIVDRSKKN